MTNQVKKFLFFNILLLNGFLCYSQVYLPKTNTIVKLDGKLDEQVWQQALRITDFKQFEPNLGIKASESPIVYVMYDDQYLYVGAKITYKDPSKMFAKILERDVPLNRDDYLEIHIDSYNDHTNSLVFSTNPLGSRYDYEVNRNGQEINSSWNAFWDVSTSIEKYGWSMEMRIPFTSLRYLPLPENKMLIKAVINYKNNNERILSPLLETDRQPILYQYKNALEVTLKGLPSLKPMFITPYVKGGIISENKLNSSNTDFINITNVLEEKGFVKNNALDKVLSNIGVDFKYRPNPNQALDITLNTDFAQAEADDRVINNTRFPIFLSEKRLFFLENADLFNSNQFNHRLFHSRRIGIENGQTVPIIAGIRFIGKGNNFEYGFLSMQTNKIDDVIPTQNMSIVRLRRRIGQLGSYIGFLGTSKISNNNYNYLTAIDGSIRIKNNLLTQFTFASTFDKVEGNFKYMYGATINTFKSNGFGFEYRFREYTKGFNPELGFVSRPNTKRITLNHGWRKTYTNHSFLQRISIGNWTTRYWISSTNRPQFLQTNIYSSITFKSGYNFGMFFPVFQEDNLFTPWGFSQNIIIPKGNYKMWNIEPFFSTGNAHPYVISGSAIFGQFYGGNRATYQATFNYDFTKKFQTELGVTINRFKYPSNYSNGTESKVNSDLYYSRFKFSFSSKSFLNTYIQYDTNDEIIGWNIRFRFTPNEATNLYIVYNQNINSNRISNPIKLPVTNNLGLTIKFSRTFF